MEWDVREGFNHTGKCRYIHGKFFKKTLSPVHFVLCNPLLLLEFDLYMDVFQTDITFQTG